MHTDVRLLERLPTPGHPTASHPGYFTWDGGWPCTVSANQRCIEPRPTGQPAHLAATGSESPICTLAERCFPTITPEG